MKLIFLTFVLTTSVLAQMVPVGMTYQGRLSDASGAPVPDGIGYEIEIRLWNSSTGGTLLWGARYTGVPLKIGAFNLILGSGGTPISGAATTDLKTAFSSANVHLGLTATKNASGASIPSPAEILPRQQIFSTPYAFRAETAAAVQTDGVLSSAIKDGEVMSADIADAAVTTSKLPAAVIDNSKIAQQTITPDRFAPVIAVFSQQQANGTNPQQAIRGWQKRELNTTDALVGTGITLNDTSDQISLVAGVYEVHAEVPYYSHFYNNGYGSRHRVGIRKVSDASIVALSSSTEQAGEVNNGFMNAFAAGSLGIAAVIVVPTGTESFELVHHIQDTTGATLQGTNVQGTDGTETTRGFCGIKSSGSGLPEVYSRITIKRIQ